MRKKIWLLALIMVLLLGGTTAWAADRFYVIPSGTSVGTKITSLPYPITAPGYYCLARNLSYSGGDGITVSADNVTIDLMGFVLTGPSNNSYAGVKIFGPSNVEVRNGTVTGWKYGIWGNGSNFRVIGVRARDNTFGINLGGSGHLVKNCMASQGSFGTGWGIAIGHGTISNCIAMNYSSTFGGLNNDNGGTITGSMVLNCTSIGGVFTFGATTISYNFIYSSNPGISAVYGGSVIGNMVFTNSGQTGITPSTSVAVYNMVDQNTVSGAGTPYGPGGTATAWGINGGR